jgi:hypothetical protein
MKKFRKTEKERLRNCKKAGKRKRKKKIQKDKRGEAEEKETTEEMKKRKGKSGGRDEKFKTHFQFGRIRNSLSSLSVRPHFKC